MAEPNPAAGPADFACSVLGEAGKAFGDLCIRSAAYERECSSVSVCRVFVGVERARLMSLPRASDARRRAGLIWLAADELMDGWQGCG